jgi:hypothetical protein
MTGETEMITRSEPEDAIQDGSIATVIAAE